MKTLGVSHPGGPVTQVVKVEKNGEVVSQKMESGTFTIFCDSFRQGSVLLFENGFSEL